MELEKEIKQSKFKSEQQKMSINILYTANWFYAIHSSSLKKYDLTPEQFNILRILRGQHPKPATINLLIERMLNKMSNASRLVDKLILKELAERKSCKDDRRAVDVSITEKGLKLLKELDKEEFNWQAKIKLTEKEAKQLNFLLDKVRS